MRTLILGDSTSFTGGFQPATYPIHLARHKGWPPGSEIINPSIAGMTSADAARFLTQYRKKYSPPDALIIYLGNCDACSTLYPKGRASFLGRLKSNRNRNSSKYAGLNVMRPFVYDADFDQSREQPEDLNDFAYNLEKIISRSSEAKIIVVTPVANKNFVAGSGKGNFLFYHVFGISPDIQPSFIDTPDELEAALHSEIKGDLSSAIAGYQTLLNSFGDNRTQNESLQIAQNNLAILMAEQGDVEKAIPLLEELSTLPGARNEIALYNLSRIKLHSGSTKEAQQLLEAAYEKDRSNYRIRAPYREVLKNLKERHKSIQLIDLDDADFENGFIDHCHLASGAQKKIAEQIADKLDLNQQQKFTATIETCPVSPEYAFNNDQLLSEFVFSGRDLDSTKTTKDKERLIEAVRVHPLFSDGRDIELNPLRLRGEMGRYPDAYMIRLLAPYLHYAERHNLIAQFGKIAPANLANRLKLLNTDSLDYIANEENLSFAADADRLNLLKDKVVERLLDFVESNPSMGFRYRTMMYWFFRESLRYGAHSRLSMLYDRVALDTAVEAILGVAVLGHSLKNDQSEWCRMVIALVQDLITELESKAETWLVKFNAATPAHENIQPNIKSYEVRIRQLRQSR